MIFNESEIFVAAIPHLCSASIKIAPDIYNVTKPENLFKHTAYLSKIAFCKISIYFISQYGNYAKPSSFFPDSFSLPNIFIFALCFSA